ncbi:MAG: ABC transporter permease [Christensenellales bacterium]|jgi:multidrug/hemolysin transport system permease protein
MNAVIALIKRNTRLFLRDKPTVFFSFLSTLILVALYFLFIAKIYTDSLDTISAEGAGLLTLNSGEKNFIVYLKMMAGVLVLNSVSLATGVFSTIAKDFETRRIDSFLLTPVKRYKLIMSYFITGLLVSLFINIITWLISAAAIGISTGYWIAALTLLKSLAVLLVSSLISCSLMLLVTTLVKSSTAIGVINGVLGTFIGFLCGIYLPYSNLGESTKMVGSLLPFSHIAIWLKRIVLGDAFSQAGIPAEYTDILYGEFFSAENIGFLAFDAPLWAMIMGSILLGFVCLAVAYRLFGNRLKVR